MLVLKDLSLGFGGRTLFEGLDWQMKEKDRVALIGGNGTGKSTLMKVIAGVLEPDRGDVLSPKGSTFGYLPQHGMHFEGSPLFDEVKSALSSILSLENNLHEIEKKLESTSESSDSYAAILEEYDHLSERFQRLDGYRIEAEVGRVLEGLGFKREDWQKPCETFSGGWQMRIALARLLLIQPTVMLLDEPTNHLDLEARNWLESYLHSYPSSVLLVSHDRHFLDATVKRCSELAQGQINDYHGNFSYYEKERVRRYEVLLESAKRQQEEIEKIEKFIERFRYKASKATQVQSRVRQLEKIERIEIPPAPKKLSFSFPKPPRSGKTVLELSKITKSYDGHHQVLSDVNLMIERGKRIALVGANGAGKSTMMKIMADKLSFEGECTLGYQVEMAYFAQDQAQVLNPEHRVYQALEEVSPYEMIPKLRTLLGCFLFQGEDIDKKVNVLSGGERNRLALARMLLQPSNLLLLDEPTNHLDIQSKDVLLDSLKIFEGTIVFVSHDRYFLNELADEIVEVRDGSLHKYIGNYEEYLREKTNQGEVLLEDGVSWSIEDSDHTDEHRNKGMTALREREASSPEKQSRQERYYEVSKKKRDIDKKRRKLQKELETIESSTETLEEQIKAFEDQMSQNGFYDHHETSAPILEEYDRAKDQLEVDLSRWETVSLSLSEIEEELSKLDS